MFRKENFTEIYDAQKRTHLGEGVTCAVKNRLVRDECIMRSGQQSARLEIEKWLGDKEVKANRRMRSTNWFFRSFEPTSGWTSLSGWNAIGTMKINCLFNNQSWSIQINDGIASDRDPACRVASFSCYPDEWPLSQWRRIPDRKRRLQSTGWTRPGRPRPPAPWMPPDWGSGGARAGTPGASVTGRRRRYPADSASRSPRRSWTGRTDSTCDHKTFSSSIQFYANFVRQCSRVLLWPQQVPSLSRLRKRNRIRNRNRNVLDHILIIHLSTYARTQVQPCAISAALDQSGRNMEFTYPCLSLSAALRLGLFNSKWLRFGFDLSQWWTTDRYIICTHTYEYAQLINTWKARQKNDVYKTLQNIKLMQNEELQYIWYFKSVAAFSSAYLYIRSDF